MNRLSDAAAKLGVWLALVNAGTRRSKRGTTLGFGVNAAGAQIDYVVLENGLTMRREYEAVWEAGSRVTETA